MKFDIVEAVLLKALKNLTIYRMDHFDQFCTVLDTRFNCLGQFKIQFDGAIDAIYSFTHYFIPLA